MAARTGMRALGRALRTVAVVAPPRRTAWPRTATTAAATATAARTFVTASGKAPVKEAATAEPSAAATSKATRKNGGLYMWVENLFNRVDRGRLLHEGPDRVAAEYVLRMGGRLVLRTSDGLRQAVKSLDELPGSGQLVVLEADLGGNTATDVGAEHFQELQHLEALRLADSPLLSDGVVDAIRALPALRDLDLSGTPISPAAARKLGQTATLRRLSLERMPAWSSADRAAVRADLSARLPHCTILT